MWPLVVQLYSSNELLDVQLHSSNEALLETVNKGCKAMTTHGPDRQMLGAGLPLQGQKQQGTALLHVNKLQSTLQQLKLDKVGSLVTNLSDAQTCRRHVDKIRNFEGRKNFLLNYLLDIFGKG